MNQQFILGRVVAPILLAVCLLLTFAPVTNLSKGWDDVIEQFEREIFGDYMVDEFDDDVEEMIEEYIDEEIMDDIEDEIEDLDTKKAYKSIAKAMKTAVKGKYSTYDILFGFDFIYLLNGYGYGDIDEDVAMVCLIYTILKVIFIIYIIVVIVGIVFTALGGDKGAIAPMIMSILGAIFWSLFNGLFAIALVDSEFNLSWFDISSVCTYLPFVFALAALIISTLNNKKVPVSPVHNAPVYSGAVQNEFTPEINPEAQAMQYCPQCGNQNPVGCKFCGTCGEKLI